MRRCTVFNDIGAVVHFLRKIIWIVPGFTVDSYRSQTRARQKRMVHVLPRYSISYSVKAGSGG